MKEILKNKSSDDYGNNYQAHVLEMYKMYVEMADRISSRRQTANSFFLSINSAIIGFSGYVKISNSNANSLVIIALAGILLCFVWYRLVRSYKDLNSGKFKVIHEIEKELPLSPFDAEWEAIGRGKDSRLYLPFTNLELRIPLIFAFLHFVLFLTSVHWYECYYWIRDLICN